MNIINIKLKNRITKSNIFLIGFIYIRDNQENIKRDKLKLRINDSLYNIKFPFKRIKNIKLIDILSNLYIIKIPIKNLVTQNIHNKPFFVYKDDENNKIEKKFSLRYSLLGRKRRYLNSRVKILRDIGTSIYIRQSAKNRLIITVRETNRTDNFKEQIKINLACLLSKFIPKYKIIMYEKEAEKYEESASIIYEKLIDEGYKNIYYIIDKNSVYINNIQEKYRKKLIYKYTFKHYLAFFTAKTLIASESPRTCNRTSRCK